MLTEWLWLRDMRRRATCHVGGPEVIRETHVTACPYRRRNQLWIGVSVRCAFEGGYHKSADERWRIIDHGVTKVHVQPFPGFGVTFSIHWAHTFERASTTPVSMPATVMPAVTRPEFEFEEEA